MDTRTWASLSHAMLLAGLCTACGSLATDGTPVDPSRADGARAAAARHGGADGVTDFTARAAPGEAAVVTSADGTSRLQVRVENEYHAASGRTCRRLTLADEGGRPNPRVACRDQLGAWRLLPLLRNRDLPAVQPEPDFGPSAGYGS